MFIYGTDGKTVKVHYQSQRVKEYMMWPSKGLLGMLKNIEDRL